MREQDIVREQAVVAAGQRVCAVEECPLAAAQLVYWDAEHADVDVVVAVCWWHAYVTEEYGQWSGLELARDALVAAQHAVDRHLTAVEQALDAVQRRITALGAQDARSALHDPAARAAWKPRTVGTRPDGTPYRWATPKYLCWYHYSYYPGRVPVTQKALTALCERHDIDQSVHTPATFERITALLAGGAGRP